MRNKARNKVKCRTRQELRKKEAKKVRKMIHGKTLCFSVQLQARVARVRVHECAGPMGIKQ